MGKSIAQEGAWLPNSLHTKAIIGLIQWSQGGLVLDDALNAIVAAFGAECGTISRVWLNKQSQKVAARADTSDQSRRRPLFLSFVNDVLGPIQSKPKRGSIFSMRTHGKETCDLPYVLIDWVSERKIDDIVFVCLDNRGQEIDFLELHFSRGCGANFLDGIEAMASDLSGIYHGRRAGLVTESISRESVVSMKRPVEDAPILGTDNPAGLTRAEWRVAILISRGLSIQSIGSELDIGPATIRTHLKHIYSKTGYDNFHMLARRLVSIEEREAMHGRHHQVFG